MTTFCWLPPESSLARVIGEPRLDAEARRSGARRAAFASRWPYQESAPRLGAEDDLADVEEDALVEHQSVAAAIGRHQADAAPRRFGRAARQAAAVGEDDLAGRAPSRCRTACRAASRRPNLRGRQGRRPRRHRAVKSTCRRARRRSAPRRRSRPVPARGSRGSGGGNIASCWTPIIPSITSGMVSARGILRQHVAAVAGDGDAIGDGKHFLQPVRDVEHGDAARRATAASTANSRSVSRLFSAEFGSSRMSRRGSSRRTRQSSTSCCSPMLSRLDRRVHVDVQAEPVEHVAALRPPSPGSRRSRCAAARG